MSASLVGSEMCIRDSEKNPADIPTKAVNADLIDRHLQFVNLRWEDGRAARALRLAGLSWNMLGPDGATLGCGPACAGAASPRAEMKADKKAVQRVSWADTSDAHDDAEY
eukprot:2788070-Alexandrium_andersonii.AAC.1